MSLYSNSNGVSVPESLIFFIAYHTAAPHHTICGPCGEARVSHIGGPVVQGREDVAARSIFVISSPPEEIFSRFPIRVLKMRSCVELSICDEVRLVGMASLDSSSSVRVISSPGSGGVSKGDPEASSSGASSGPPSPIDARVLRDLEVMKADHDLDTAVTEGSLAVIRGRYSIPIEYGLYVSRLG
ncbi:hypothetical protein BHE74_00042269 [Ensete ventricosum]|nr:hypothetical protein BHE74_00042269 [Ensete ventricosum]